MQEYRPKKPTSVIAVRLELDTEGSTYQKWGGTQRGKRGDWRVSNQGDVYTVDGETFACTYRQVSPSVYEKGALVGAEPVSESGTIQTKEGSTAYQAGDDLVFDDPGGHDGYTV